MSPAETQIAPPPPIEERAHSLWTRYKWFTIVVLAPTLIVAAYLYFVASDQYVSEAHFVVKSASSSSGSGGSSSSGLSGLFGGGSSTSTIAAVGESLAVSDYLMSHDAVSALQKQLDLVRIWRRPGVDWLSTIRVTKPTPEFLESFYKSQVDVYFDTDNGITTLTARAFTPDDAYAIASQLLQLGERRVNVMNVRAYRDAVALSKGQLDEAERNLRAIGGRVTAFRQTEKDVDPAGSASAQISLVSRLRGELSAARSQLATTSRLIGGSNPQIDALRQQIRSLEAQVAAQDNVLAGNNTAIAAGLGNFEQLQMQQGFLQQRYTTAGTNYETARQQALRQQVYLVRIVDPNMPVKSIYPRRFVTLLTIFVVLLVVYSIGWLIAAGVREHAA